MDKAFLAAYVDLLIQTCHRRGIHAMGGMAAQIPIKDDPAANDAATKKVEPTSCAKCAPDTTARGSRIRDSFRSRSAMFDEHMPSANQIERARADVKVTRDDLLRIPEGVVTEKGLRQNINVGIHYLEAWLGGSGACRSTPHGRRGDRRDLAHAVLAVDSPRRELDDGRTVDADLYRRIRDEELASIGERPHLATAARIFDDLILASDLADFLTIPAYEELLKDELTRSREGD